MAFRASGRSRCSTMGRTASSSARSSGSSGAPRSPCTQQPPRHWPRWQAKGASSTSSEMSTWSTANMVPTYRAAPCLSTENGVCTSSGAMVRERVYERGSTREGLRERVYERGSTREGLRERVYERGATREGLRERVYERGATFRDHRGFGWLEPWHRPYLSRSEQFSTAQAARETQTLAARIAPQ